jgi:hypothetical protein
VDHGDFGCACVRERSERLGPDRVMPASATTCVAISLVASIANAK